MRYKIVNGIKVQLTTEEENELNLEQAKFEEERQLQIQKEQDAINKKASGKQKLLDLGLTEEEVKALIGV
jgi:hypothetical protein